MSRDKVVLMACPMMEAMAKQVAEKFGYGSGLSYSPISWKKFPDGFPNTSVDIDKIRNAHVWFFACLDSPAEIFNQFSVLDAIPRFGAKSLKIVLPFYPTGTMERAKKSGEIVTAKTLARMFDTIPGNAGTPRVFTFDIHDEREQFYFSNNTILFLETAMTRLTRSFDSWSVAFPDVGAYNRFGTILNRFPQILCDKIRKGDKRIVVPKEGKIKDEKILLIDDMTRTGETLIECAKVLKAEGASVVDGVISHPAFNSVAAFKKLLQAHRAGVINRFYTTDSCPIINMFVDNEFVFVTPIAELVNVLINREEFGCDIF